MKRKAVAVIALVIMVTFGIGSVFATKPSDNHASAQTVPWKASADVMPVPPYGSIDISGSDTASKLIINQPNGKVVVTLTGIMKGLTPNTNYTVYISDGYTAYNATTLTGDTWAPGLFSEALQPLTFTTNEKGSANWHLNIKNTSFSEPGSHDMSVWINDADAGLTLLASATFSVEN